MIESLLTEQRQSLAEQRRLGEELASANSRISHMQHRKDHRESAFSQPDLQVLPPPRLQQSEQRNSVRRRLTQDDERGSDQPGPASRLRPRKGRATISAEDDQDLLAIPSGNPTRTHATSFSAPPPPPPIPPKFNPPASHVDPYQSDEEDLDEDSWDETEGFAPEAPEENLAIIMDPAMWHRIPPSRRDAALDTARSFLSLRKDDQWAEESFRALRRLLNNDTQGAAKILLARLTAKKLERENFSRPHVAGFLSAAGDAELPRWLKDAQSRGAAAAKVAAVSCSRPAKNANTSNAKKPRKVQKNGKPPAGGGI